MLHLPLQGTVSAAGLEIKRGSDTVASLDTYGELNASSVVTNSLRTRIATVNAGGKLALSVVGQTKMSVSAAAGEVWLAGGLLVSAVPGCLSWILQQ